MEAKIPMKEVLGKINVTVKATGYQAAMLRVKIGLLLIQLGALTARLNFKTEEDADNAKENN